MNNWNKFNKKWKDIDMIELIEKEMIMLWCSDEIPHLLKADEDFVSVITSAIMLERGYWNKFMVVGES